MREVDLIKRLSQPNIIKYEGMTRDENTLSILLECVIPFLVYMPLPTCCCKTWAFTDFGGWLRVACQLQIRREWLARTDSQGVQQTEGEAGGEPCVQDSRGPRLPAPERRCALRPQGGQHSHDEDWERKAVRLWRLA